MMMPSDRSVALFLMPQPEKYCDGTAMPVINAPPEGEY
jgi:hypothetical protein